MSQGGEMMNLIWGMLSVKCLLANPEMFSRQLDLWSGPGFSLIGIGEVA